MKLAETKRQWEKWIPGVLSKHQIIELRDKGLITGMGPDKTIDHSSFDLSPSSEAYRMKKGAVKPSGAHPYSWFIEKNGLAEKFEPNPDGTFTLETKHTYVLKLREKLQRGLTDGGLYGQATA